MDVQNPLYVKKTDPTEPKPTREAVLARIENTVAGVCPKCKQTMIQAALGQSMGNQKVYFCNTCRVAEPLPHGSSI